MNSRKVRRGRGAGLGPGRRPRRSSGGGGGAKKGLCEFAIPYAAAALLVLAAQFALASWNSRMGVAQ